MNTIDINNKLETIEAALQWEKNVPESERLNYRQKLINIRRELKKIKYAVEEKPSAAAFGESQMGKSYLVSAMLSTPNSPFCVTDGNTSYNFIDEINPSLPGSTIEATGVITRFTTESSHNAPEGYLRAQLLSVSDVILMLCEAYYNQIDYSHESIIDAEVINTSLSGITLAPVIDGTQILSDDDVLDIREYLQTSSIQKKCHAVLSSRLFDYLVMNVSKLSNSQLLEVLKLLWNRNEDINRIFDDLIRTYAQLGYKQEVFVEFSAVLKKHGTLLDVARLDEMYGEAEVKGASYTGTTTVKVNGNTLTLPKSFFSALIAELTFVLPSQLAENREFLNKLDILDFPGSRRPEQIKEGKLKEGKNLSTVFRRGKVSYLFNKYSASKRISTLLFCHNNSQSAESTMGITLSDWVTRNIGENAMKRDAFVRKSKLSPLFIIGTWFNKDLEYHNESPGDNDRLNERWQRRFNTVLEKEVLKSIGDAEHWFNNWSTSAAPFRNIFMLRDFKYSNMIFKGYDPDTQSPEQTPYIDAKFPSFLQDLKESFVGNDFVRLHFDAPSVAWDEAATVGNDGTKPIIGALNQIAPNVADAREDKFSGDLTQQKHNIRALLDQYYHPESSDEQLKQAKRQAGAACLQIDRLNGMDSYFFGRMMDSMMITESSIYEVVHQKLLGAEQALPMTGVESSIFMGAGLDSSDSRENNIERLCDYLGMYDEDECREYLQGEGVDIDNLLNQSQMVASKADTLVTTIENMWHETFMQERCSNGLKDKFVSIDSIISNMWTVYRVLKIHDLLVNKVNDYINALSKEVSVGIVADYLAMSYNRFVNSFGYEFMSDADKQNILKQNAELHLNLNEDLLNQEPEAEGVSLLADLYSQKEVLSASGFGQNDKKFLMRFPQYSRMWRWQQQLRVGYIFACNLPDFDVKANAELKRIIEKV